VLSTSLTSAFFIPNNHNSLLKVNSNKKEFRSNFSAKCCLNNNRKSHFGCVTATVTTSLFHLHSHNNIQNHEGFLLNHDHNHNHNHNHNLDHNHDDEKNNNDANNNHPHDQKINSRERRAFFQGMLNSLLLVARPQNSNAQFVQFPCVNGFGNTYHFVRAGESLMEEEGVWTTNPLFLTNRESALSPTGIEQVEQTCQKLKQDGFVPTIVRYSLAANAMDTSNTVGTILGVGRDRNVPEYTLLDPRAIGMWDMSEKNTTQPAVWALDAAEAGLYGMEGRPPANIDGTPHETLADQTVRLRQLLSVLETLYSGDTILLIFPDGTGPALLTCLIGGIPLYRVHEFEFQPGEARLNINYDSARALLDSRPSPRYLEQLEEGKVQLKRLLNNPEESNNVRDKQYEREVQLELDKKNKLETELASKLEQEARVKKERQLAEEARRKNMEQEIRMKREAQLAEMNKQKEADIARLREKQMEDRQERTRKQQEKDKESKEKVIQANAEAQQKQEEKDKRNAEIAEIARQKAEDNRIQKNAQIAEAARRKEIQKEYKMSQKAQLADIQQQKNENNEPGGLDILIGGGALISAGGAAYLFLQDQEQEDSELESADGSHVVTIEASDKTDVDRDSGDGSDVITIEASDETDVDLAKRLKAEKEAKRRAEEIAREQAQEEARKKAKEKEEARAAAKEEARIKAATVEAERLRVEEEARSKAAADEAERRDRILAQRGAKASAKEAVRLKAKSEEEARLKVEEEATRKAEEEVRLKAEEEAKLKAEEEAKLKAEEEEVERVQAEEDARLKAEEDEAARIAAEEEARLKKMTKREQLTWNPDEDDGGMAWLDSLAEMITEDDDDENDEASETIKTP